MVCRRIPARVRPHRASRNLKAQQLVIKDPVGPVAAFTPWNFPINQVVRKLAAALAAGCSILVKAPEETPASPAELIRAFADAGVPAGTVGLVYGDPAEISNYLIPHPVIRKVTFTGSTPWASNWRPGWQAHEARDDGAGWPRPGHRGRGRRRRAGHSRGQRRQVPQRGSGLHLAHALLVHESIRPEFVAAFARHAQNLKVGDGLAEGTQMGPWPTRAASPP